MGMTVKQLKAALKDYPDDLEVTVSYIDGLHRYTVRLANSMLVLNSKKQFLLGTLDNVVYTLEIAVPE